MGAKAKHDIAPLARGAFIRALDLIEQDTGKTFPEMMRDCIMDHGLLAVMDKLAKYTVREKHTTQVNEIKPAAATVAVESWLAEFQSANIETQPDESITPSQVPDKRCIQ